MLVRIMKLKCGPLIFGLLMSCASAEQEHSRSVKTEEVLSLQGTATPRVVGPWRLERLWNNGSVRYFGNACWDFSEDGIITWAGVREPDRLDFGHYELFAQSDSIRINMDGVEELRGGIRLYADTLLITSFGMEGAGRTVLSRLSFSTSEVAFNNLRLDVARYEYVDHGSQVRVRGTIHNDSKFDFKDIEAEIQVYAIPNFHSSPSMDNVALYSVHLPYMLAGVSMPYERTLEVPAFVKSPGQKLYGWQLVVHYPANQ